MKPFQSSISILQLFFFLGVSLHTRTHTYPKRVELKISIETTFVSNHCTNHLWSQFFYPFFFHTHNLHSFHHGILRESTSIIWVPIVGLSSKGIVGLTCIAIVSLTCRGIAGLACMAYFGFTCIAIFGLACVVDFWPGYLSYALSGFSILKIRNRSNFFKFY